MPGVICDTQQTQNIDDGSDTIVNAQKLCKSDSSVSNKAENQEEGNIKPTQQSASHKNQCHTSHDTKTMVENQSEAAANIQHSNQVCEEATNEDTNISQGVNGTVAKGKMVSTKRTENEDNTDEVDGCGIIPVRHETVGNSVDIIEASVNGVDFIEAGKAQLACETTGMTGLSDQLSQLNIQEKTEGSQDKHEVGRSCRNKKPVVFQVDVTGLEDQLTQLNIQEKAERPHDKEDEVGRSCRNEKPASFKVDVAVVEDKDEANSKAKLSAGKGHKHIYQVESEIIEKPESWDHITDQEKNGSHHHSTKWLDEKECKEPVEDDEGTAVQEGRLEDKGLQGPASFYTNQSSGCNYVPDRLYQGLPERIQVEKTSVGQTCSTGKRTFGQRDIVEWVGTKGRKVSEAESSIMLSYPPQSKEFDSLEENMIQDLGILLRQAEQQQQQPQQRQLTAVERRRFDSTGCGVSSPESESTISPQNSPQMVDESSQEYTPLPDIPNPILNGIHGNQAQLPNQGGYEINNVKITVPPRYTRSPQGAFSGGTSVAVTSNSSMGLAFESIKQPLPAYDSVYPWISNTQTTMAPTGTQNMTIAQPNTTMTQRMIAVQSPPPDGAYAIAPSGMNLCNGLPSPAYSNQSAGSPRCALGSELTHFNENALSPPNILSPVSIDENSLSPQSAVSGGMSPPRGSTYQEPLLSGSPYNVPSPVGQRGHSPRLEVVEDKDPVIDKMVEDCVLRNLAAEVSGSMPNSTLGVCGDERQADIEAKFEDAINFVQSDLKEWENKAQQNRAPGKPSVAPGPAPVEIPPVSFPPHDTLNAKPAISQPDNFQPVRIPQSQTASVPVPGNHGNVTRPVSCSNLHNIATVTSNTLLLTQPVTTPQQIQNTMPVLAPGAVVLQNPPKTSSVPVYFFFSSMQSGKKPNRLILPKPTQTTEADRKVVTTRPGLPAPPKCGQNVVVSRAQAGPDVRMSKLRKMPDHQKQHAWCCRKLASLTRQQMLTPDESGDLPLHLTILSSEQDQHPARQLAMCEAYLSRLKREGILHLAINAQNNQKQTPLYIATVKKKRDIVELLIEYGADVNICSQVRTKASPRGEVKNALHYAASHGEPFSDILKLLVRAPGVDVNLTNGDGHTPLHCAALHHGKIDFVTQQPISGELTIWILISHGAQLDVPDGSSKTPIHYIVETKDLDLVRQVLTGMNIPNLRDLLNKGAHSGNTILHMAVGLQIKDLDKHEKLIRLLLMNGADPSLKNGEGYLPREMVSNQKLKEILTGPKH